MLFVLKLLGILLELYCNLDNPNLLPFNFAIIIFIFFVFDMHYRLDDNIYLISTILITCSTIHLEADVAITFLINFRIQVIFPKKNQESMLQDKWDQLFKKSSLRSC